MITVTRLLLLIGVALVASFAVTGQQQPSVKTQLYFPVPAESVLLTVASQPDCPLKIEDAKLLASTEGSLRQLYDYRVNNTGTKPIASYTLAVWTAEGTGSTLTPTKLDVPLYPGGRSELVSSRRDIQVVPVTEQLLQKQKLNAPLRIVAVLMIQTVHFSDGSFYTANDLSSSLEEYFLKLNGFPVTGDNKRNSKKRLPQPSN